MEDFCDHFSAIIFEWLFLILAGGKVTHKSLNEFRTQPPTKNYLHLSV